MNAIAPLQIELFVNDLAISIDFYTRVAGFAIADQQSDGYTAMSNGPIGISLNKQASLPPDHAIYVAPGERPGRGVEFVLKVGDLQALYAHVRTEGWPIRDELMRRPWGAEDFRLEDPDGYYWRFTTVA
jgi:lactoylglutathione lyase